MRFPLVLLLLFFSGVFDASRGAEPAPSKAIENFKKLQEKYRTQSDQYWKEREAVGDDLEKDQKLYETKYPGNTISQEFLDLETQYRGTQVGLSCLHHLISTGGGNSRSELPASTSKRKALVLLREHYANDPDLDVILGWVNSGAFYPEETERLCERAAGSPYPYVRGTALYVLARHMKLKSTVPQAHELLRSLMTEADADMPTYKFLERIEPYYRDIDVAESRRRCLELIEQVRKDFADFHTPPRTDYGPILLDIDRTAEDPTRENIGQLAEQMKYELQHLAIGQKSPDIDQHDAFGKPLHLHAHRGKAVVLMFSFKGCGPCEYMYPDNRKLIEEMQGRPFAFLGVMGDDQVDTVHEAVESGTITWPVWWNGADKKLSKQWNVSGWPGIYVLDHTGTIRYKGLRHELLARAVYKLVEEAEAAQTESSEN